jgi:ABC-type phosphate transport system substrate-binding protein
MSAMIQDASPMNRIQRLWTGSAILCALIALGASAAHASERALVLVTNLKTPLPNVSVTELRALYLGESMTLGGQSFRAINYTAGNPFRNAFEEHILRMTDEQFANHWRSKRFLGSFQKQPASFKSAEAVKRFVAAERDAIGYIPKASVDNTVNVVPKLDSIPVGAKSYPLLLPP